MYLSGWFLIDLFSSIPIDQILGSFPEDLQNNPNIKILSYIKYMKMLRLFKISRMMRIFKIL